MPEESVEERLSREVDRAIANLAKHHGIALPADDPIINYLYLNIDIIQSSFGEPLKKLKQVESRISSIHHGETVTALEKLKDLTRQYSVHNISHFNTLYSLLLALEKNHVKSITVDDKLNQLLHSSAKTAVDNVYKPILITCLLSVLTTVIVSSIVIIALVVIYADKMCLYLPQLQ